MPTPLPDADARETIIRELDRNLVVEAAAGTGKTTCLVGRVMNLFKQGRHRIAAVTFTHKAAAELRERLERRLAALLADPGLPESERRDLAAAQGALPESHIGTIHSFCARMLRERPVEAGVSPEFREIDDADDAFLRDRAWGEFSRALARGDHAGLYAVFETFGLDLDTLGLGFRKFADFPDVDEWAGADAGAHQIDAESFMNGVDEYYRSLPPLQPLLHDADPGTDKLMPVAQTLLRRRPRLTLPLAVADAFHLAGLFKPLGKTGLTQRPWLALGLSKDDILGLVARYESFLRDYVLPFRDRCQASVYASAIEAFRLARDIYDRLRRDAGALNFQDLLLTASAMLRDYPDVRRDMAERYPHLLIDEVQDTDPVQAEIMFFLASRDDTQRDWRLCPPRPGALFIVGDPKQSIYRFRRADIVVYQDIKKLILRHGGMVLELSTNFRSQPAILHWVNETFCLADAPADAAATALSGRFAPVESAHSPAYVPLLAGREAHDDCLSGVFALETKPLIKKEGITGEDILSDEAARIAAFIRHAVDTGRLVADGDSARPARPDDFLVITYNKNNTDVYAAALRGMGLQCRVSGGPSLGDSPALALLKSYLAALDNPDDPLQLVGVLRGGLFGISDPDLYQWKTAGHAFTFTRVQPGRAPAAIAEALACVHGHWRLFQRLDPASALSRVLDDLGLWAYASLGDDPSAQAGVLATALELLRLDAPPTLCDLVERLDWHMTRHDKDPVAAAPGDDNYVRIMNLHKTKGLEAPVVFLASTRNLQKHPVAFAVKRNASVTVAAMTLGGGPRGNTVLAKPLEWEALAREEELFLAAEKTRLHYVAATRAGSALIVSTHCAGKERRSGFLPQLSGSDFHLPPLPEPAVPPRPGTGDQLRAIDVDAVDSSGPAREDRLAAALSPSYTLARGKPDSDVGAVISRSGVSEGDREYAMAYGEISHLLLNSSAVGDALRGRAGELLREFSLPADELDPILAMVTRVRASDIWRRAREAERMLQEVPFSVSLGGGGETPVLQHGVIDLAFREALGWVVVDFKSDTVADTALLKMAAERHAEQLRSYSRAWERITGEAVVETGIYFLRYDVYVPLCTDVQQALF